MIKYRLDFDEQTKQLRSFEFDGRLVEAFELAAVPDPSISQSGLETLVIKLV